MEVLWIDFVRLTAKQTFAWHRSIAKSLLSMRKALFPQINSPGLFQTSGTPCESSRANSAPHLYYSYIEGYQYRKSASWFLVLQYFMGHFMNFLTLLIFLSWSFEAVMTMPSKPRDNKHGSVSRSVSRRRRAGIQSSVRTAGPSNQPLQGNERDVHFMPPMPSHTVAPLSFSPQLAPQTQHMHRQASSKVVKGVEIGATAAAITCGAVGTAQCVKGCTALYKNRYRKATHHFVDGTCSCAAAGCCAGTAAILRAAGHHQ